LILLSIYVRRKGDPDQKTPTYEGEGGGWHIIGGGLWWRHFGQYFVGDEPMFTLKTSFTGGRGRRGGDFEILLCSVLLLACFLKISLIV
jgi:hypothetical protein